MAMMKKSMTPKQRVAMGKAKKKVNPYEPKPGDQFRYANTSPGASKTPVRVNTRKYAEQVREMGDGTPVGEKVAGNLSSYVKPKVKGQYWGSATAPMQINGENYLSLAGTESYRDQIRSKQMRKKK